MKRLLLLAVALFLITLPAVADTHKITYYFIGYCESCDPAEDFARQFKALTGMDTSGCDFKAYNVKTASGRSALEAAGLSGEGLPLAVVDNIIYRGASELNVKLPEEALKWGGGTDSCVVYLYTPSCQSCARAESVLEALPEAVEVKRGDFTFSSRVVVTRHDVTRDPDAAWALFDAYSIPESDRVTPAVFLPGKALVGISQIEEFLPPYVSLGWAVGEVLAESSGIEPPATGLPATFLTGLIAGVNGCALSMLLMFISLVLSLRKNVWPCVALFLLSKLVCCLLIGYLLLALLQTLNPAWLVPSVRIMMTAITVPIAILTLHDAYFAHKGQLGRLKNQLPQGLRRKLHVAVRALTQKKWLMPASIVLGFLVAAGEFLCAGQLYLARLLGGVTAWTSAGDKFWQLLTYCLGFLAPSIAVAAAILLGRSAGAVSAFFARHIALVKLLTAGAMLLLVVMAWVY